MGFGRILPASDVAQVDCRTGPTSATNSPAKMLVVRQKSFSRRCVRDSHLGL